MKKIILGIFILSLSVNLHGQVNKYGLPLMSSYSAQLMNGADYTHGIIEDLSGNMYFANEGIGIIRYNGNDWRTIPVRNNALIRALGIDNRGTVYAGGKYEFGFLAPDNYGKITYVSLSERIEEWNNRIRQDTLDSGRDSTRSETINFNEVFSLVVADSSVLYVTSGYIFSYDIYNDSLSFINLKEFDVRNAYKGFLVNGKVFIGDNIAGVFEYNDGEIRELPGGDFFEDKICMSVLQYDESNILVATYYDGIFLYNYITGAVRSFINSDLTETLISSRIYSGVKLPSGDFAIGTIQDGIYVINPGGSLVSHWDIENSDLMDNGILYLYCTDDPNSVLWVSSVKYITKVFVNLPFTEYTIKSGLDGGVNYMSEFEGEIFISTDLGVYESTTDENGIRKFVKIPEINDPTYPICNARIGNQQFLLIGGITGLYQINWNGELKQIIALNKDNVPTVIDFDIRNITQSEINPEKFYLTLDKGGFIVIQYHAGIWKYEVVRTQGSILGIVEADNGDLILGTDLNNGLFRKPLNDSVLVTYTTEKGAPSSSIKCLVEVDSEIYLGAGDGIYKYNKNTDSWSASNDITGGYSQGKEVVGILVDDTGDLWVSLKSDTKYEDILFIKNEERVDKYYGPLAILPNVSLMDIKCFDNRVFLAKSKSVYIIEKNRLLEKQAEIMPGFERILVGQDSIIMEESFFVQLEDGRKIAVKDNQGGSIPEFRYTLNSLSFSWSLPFYFEEESNLFSYKLEGFDSKWSSWEKLHSKEYTNLPFGHYFFKVKAKTVTDLESPEITYEFIILKPWYLKAYMMILYIIALVFIILGIVRAYTRKLKNENIRLEGIVAERTAVVVKQKEELESSIHYARRIQMALLPSENILSENLGNYFILFKPRDIVSGDFYWMTKKENRLYIVAADCTGHGVPGAFMSLLGMSFLDEIIDKEEAPRADYILSELRQHVTESLKQSGGDDEAKDGMDLALLVIDYNNSQVEFSGAYNPCFRIRKLTDAEKEMHREENMEMPDGSMTDGKYLLETIYASKMPIGISSRMHEKFVFHNWELEKGVSYYLFSDGYIDQFGGNNSKKFMKKNFKRLLLEIQDYSMKRQKEVLDQNLVQWMGESPQIDDILVMGIRTE